MKKDDAIALAVAAALPAVGGALTNFIGRKGMFGVKEDKGGQAWADSLKKPKFAVPKVVFAIVDPIVNLAAGVASFLVWRNKDNKKVLSNVGLGLYGAQLIANLIWPLIFYKGKSMVGAVADSAVVTGLGAAACVVMSLATKDTKKDMGAVIGLMVPYVGWTAYATAVAAQTFKDNKEKKVKPAAPAAPAPAKKAA